MGMEFQGKTTKTCKTDLSLEYEDKGENSFGTN